MNAYTSDAEYPVGEGWYDLVDPLVEYCRNHDIPIAQIKEKFGGLRFYYNSPSGGFKEGEREELDELIRKAEAKSTKVCELCGAPGENRNIGNWLKTVCDKHYKEMKSE